MERTAQEKQYDTLLSQSPVIKELQLNDKLLLEGQDEIKAEIKKDIILINTRLDKGAEKIRGLEDEMKKLTDIVSKGFSDITTEVRDRKITDLTNELKLRKANSSYIRNSLIILSVVTTLGVIGFLFTKAYG